MNPNLLVQAIGFSLILLSSIAAASTAIDNPNMADCEPKSCGTGNGTEISYPFWLTGQQPSYCGFPQFELDCIHNTLVLSMSYDRYLVRNIFYHNQSLLVSNLKFLDAADCPFDLHNLTFNLTPFSISSANMDLFFYFHNCSQLPPDCYMVTCGAEDGTFAYLAGAYPAWEHLGSSGQCEHAVVPVVGYPGANGSDYTKLLENGFLLDWVTADCSECSASKGRCGYSSEKDRFMCICPDRLHALSCRGNSIHKIVIGVIAGISSFILVLLFFFLYFWRAKKFDNLIILCKKKSKIAQSIESFLEKYGSLAPKRYKYSDVKKMTKSFSDKLGQGGYGVVYKGKLHDGHLVAVKVLSGSKSNGEEFINEVVSIGRTSHVNVVSLLGFCYEGSKRALIYDFMPNGSLEKHIYNERLEVIPLGWENLFKIAVGIARGLEYLHRGCNTRIVHFDIKPHNILLDQDFCPKISDFGLALLCRPKESIISMCGARGTVGYIAPEVFSRNFGVISGKSDVYSYGMMVLEMVGGRRNVNAATNNASETYFPHWIYEDLDQNGDQDERFLGTLIARETKDIARKMAIVGLWCIQTMPENRPSISQVLEMLEGSISGLQMPPKPYLFSPERSVISSSTVMIP